MTVQELSNLGNEKPVLYKGITVTFVCLSMDVVFNSSRKQPMKARIRIGQREKRVFPSQLSLPESP